MVWHQYISPIHGHPAQAESFQYVCECVTVVSHYLV